MSQISPPLRIALAVAVLFGLVYMVALKPKSDSGSAPSPAPAATQAPATASASDANQAQTAPGKAVEAARGAAAATEQAQAAQAGEAAPSTSQSTPSTAAASASPATAPAAESDAADEPLEGLPAWLEKSMDEKVVAILFTNGKSADDRRTAKALKHAFTAHGKVVKRTVPIGQISKYRTVAQGVDVQQSPTLMVIDRNRQAQSLVGYASLDAVNQAIIDGILATDNPVKHVKFLQTAQRECRQITRTAIIGPAAGTSPAGARKNLNALIATMGSSLGTLRNAPAPAAYRGVKHQLTHYLARSNAVWHEVRAVAIGKHAVDTVKVRKLTHGLEKVQDRTLLELNAVGVTACN